jgi:two-component system response regulator VicR
MNSENQTKKILLVDDDNFLLDMYSTKFKKDGFDVAVADGPEQAINRLKNDLKPDILIFDLIMPKMGGIDLFKKIKSEGLVDNTVNIILSNQGKASDLEKVKDLGVDGYIVKALHTPSEVLEKVKEIYNKNK